MQKPKKPRCEVCGRVTDDALAAKNHPKSKECIAVQSENRLYDMGLNPVPHHFRGILREAQLDYKEGVQWNDTLSVQQMMLWVQPGIIVFLLNSEFRQLASCMQAFALREYRKNPEFLEAFKTARKMAPNGGVSFVMQQYEHYRTVRICGTQTKKA